MANKFQLKRTTVSGRTANTTDSGNTSFVDKGELAVNLADRKIFSSDASNVIFEVGSNLTNLAVSSFATFNNDGGIRFKDLTGNVASLRLQSDNNFVLYSTNTAGGERAVFSVFANSITSNLQVHIPFQPLSGIVANSAVGTAGQVLTSNGSGIYWQSLGQATTNVNASYVWTNSHVFTQTLVANGISISNNSAHDASLHLVGSTGGYNRFIQISPGANSVDILNIMASSNSTGGENWWSWGIEQNVYKVQVGVGFGGPGFTANSIGWVSANGFSGNGASVTSVNAATVGGNTAATLRSYSDTAATTAAGTAYSNAVTYTDSKIATANTAMAANAAAAYTNATTFASNASNLSTGTVAEARLPYRMDQNVRTTDSVVFGNLTLNGNLTVGGTTTTVTAQNLAVTDNMIYMNQGVDATITNLTANGTAIVFTANNNYAVGWDITVTNVNPTAYNATYSNILAANSTTFTVSSSTTGAYVSGGHARGKTDSNPDIGFAAGYNDGSYKHSGFFRDADDNYFKPFFGYTPEPDASPFIDTSNTSFTLAGMHTSNVRVGNTTVYATLNSTAFSGTANNADFLDGQHGSYYTNATNITTGTLPYAQIPANIINTTAEFTRTGITTFSANVVLGQSGLSANGSFGTAGHVLHSNGTATYWAADDDTNTTYDLLAVANTAVNAGLLRLKDSGNANDDVTITGSGTSTVSSNSTHIIINSADQYVGTVTSVTGGAGLTGSITASGSLAVGQGTGITVNADDIAVNASYIATISSNNATYFDGATWASPKAIGGTTANSGAFTIVTATGNVSGDMIISSNNGNGTNFKVGDDVWIGDVNQADTVRIMGQQNANNGYLVFGNANNDIKLGRTGTGALTWNSNFAVTGNLSISTINATSFGYTLTSNATTAVFTIGNSSVSATVNSTVYTGTSLTANNADFLDGQHGSYYTNASNITTGTLPYAQIPANVINTTAAFTRTGITTFSANVILGSSGLSANGGFGSAGEVLHSNGTATYWAADDQGVTSVASGNGISGGTITSTGTLYATGGSTLTINTAGIHVNSSLSITDLTLSGNATIGPRATLKFANTSIGGIPTIYTEAAGNTAASPTQTTSGSTLFSIQPNAYTGTAYTGGARIEAVATENITSLARGTKWTITAITAGSASGSPMEWDGSNLTLNTVNVATQTFSSNATNLTTGTIPYARIPANIVNTSAAFTLSGVTTHAANVILGSVGLSANGGFGTAGQVLHSNGTATYWAADDNTTYDLLAVANTAVNAGLLRLSDSSSSNDTVTFTGSGTANVSSNATHIIINSADQYTGTVTSVATGSGLTGGTITGTGTVSVLANTGIIANATGLFVNSSYIATLTANAATFSNTITSADTRATVTTPETVTGPQVRFDFKQSNTESLSDGGAYFGEMTFRPYGSGTDWSGGPSHQLGFTSNNNLYHRSGNSTTWGSWGRLYKEGTLFTPGANVILGNVGLSANGGFGTAGQVLHSNGTATYWAADDDTNTTYDLLAVANTAVNAGILRLKDSGNANDDVTFTGTGTANVSSNATHIIINSADQYTGTVTSVASGNGLTGGTITGTGTLTAVGGPTMTVNTTGIHVNSTLSITDLTLSGNLTVSGTTTYINTTTLNVGDNIVTLNADLGAAAPSQDAGIEVMRGTSANVQFIWDETNDRWSTNGQSLAANTLVVGGTTLNSTVYAGTANNADYLDGQHGSYYTNATNITTGTLPYAQIPANIVNTTAAFTLTGVTTHAANVVMSNNHITRPILTAYTEHEVSNTAATGTWTMDCGAANFFDLTLTGNITISPTNVPPSTRVWSGSIAAKQDATGGRTITWPTGTKWPGGVAPPATTTANAIDIWSIMTYDGGSTWIASLSVKNAS